MAEQEAELDGLFAALSDPTRRAVVARLANGPATVSELAAPHDMALASFMAHLTKLEKAGLIRTRKVGRVRSCALADGALNPVQHWLSEQRTV
jgi:DNA-binding transcriptional ArsR family regulator